MSELKMPTHYGYLSKGDLHIDLGSPIVEGRVYRCSIEGEPYVIKSAATCFEMLDIGLSVETAISVRLSSRGIVIPVRDVFFTGNRFRSHHILYPYASNSLGELLRSSQPISYEERKRLFYQIASVLHEVHLAGFLHGDLKADNVLIYGDRVMIADYGLSRPIEVFADTDEWVAVTLRYRPPEFLQGSRYTVKGEIWTLGLLFHELFLNYSVIDAHTPETVLDAIHRIFTSPLRFFNDPEQERLFRSMTQLQPSERDEIPTLLASPWFDSVRNAPIHLPIATPIKHPTIQRDRLAQVMDLETRFSTYFWMFQLCLRQGDSFRVFLYAAHLVDLFVSQPDVDPTLFQDRSVVPIYVGSAYFLAQMAVNTPVGLEDDIADECVITTDQLHDGIKHILSTISFDLYQRNLFYYMCRLRPYLSHQEFVLSRLLVPYVLLTTVPNLYSYLDIAVFCGELARLLQHTDCDPLDNPNLCRQFKTDMQKIIEAGHDDVLLDLYRVNESKQQTIDRDLVSVISSLVLKLKSEPAL